MNSATQANPADYFRCPRCAGTGVYSGYGTCFRCHGRGACLTKAAKARHARNDKAAAIKDEITDTRERLAKAEAVVNPNALRLASIAEMKARLAELGA